MAILPYSTQTIEEDDIDAVVRVLRSDFLTQGPAVPAFEAAFAARHQVKHAIAVANATAALHIACLALGAGPGKRVWTSPNSFVASANCALYCGAAIDFVDIDPATRNLSVPALRDKLAHAARDGALPAVVIPVDFAGLPCDLRELRALADEYGFALLEDASHATGASYQGAPVGSRWAHASVFSFHAVKIVTTAEGGMVTTNDDALAHRLRLLRSHGITRDPAELQSKDVGGWYYEQQTLGFNYRMTELQAALGSSQLQRLDAMQAARDALATRYEALLAALPVHLPARVADRTSSWHLYAVALDDTKTTASRTSVFAALRAADIGVNVHYIPIHLQPHYAQFGFRRGDFPVAERYYDHALSLPLFPRMTHAQQDHVVTTLASALSAAR
jgi:UDP-4-amino-4,6-dideoxy-N-acetyl-beta-L-altrosamine transaminase